MPIYSICSTQKPGSTLHSDDVIQKQSAICKAIAIIVGLGGLFLLLAALEVLPSGPNAISACTWGEVGGSILIVAGLLVFRFCGDRTELNLESEEVHTPGDVPPAAFNAAAPNPVAPVTKVMDVAVLEKRPKRINDRGVFEDSHWLQWSGIATRLESALKLIANNRGATVDRLKSFKLPTTPQEMKATLREHMATFKELYENGRHIITEVDPKESPTAELVHNYNEMARKLNDRILQIRLDLAKLLASVYPKAADVPPECAGEMVCAAFQLLEQARQEAVTPSGL
jgi:hypothetical protein